MTHVSVFPFIIVLLFYFAKLNGDTVSIGNIECDSVREGTIPSIGDIHVYSFEIAYVNTQVPSFSLCQSNLAFGQSFDLRLYNGYSTNNDIDDCDVNGFSPAIGECGCCGGGCDLFGSSVLEQWNDIGLSPGKYSLGIILRSGTASYKLNMSCTPSTIAYPTKSPTKSPTHDKKGAIDCGDTKTDILPEDGLHSYEFSLSSRSTIGFSLCNTTDKFDTELLLYDGTTEKLLNGAECDAPLSSFNGPGNCDRCEDYISLENWNNIQLDAGDYLIQVKGFYSSNGNYTLDMFCGSASPTQDTHDPTNDPTNAPSQPPSQLPTQPTPSPIENQTLNPSEAPTLSQTVTSTSNRYPSEPSTTTTTKSETENGTTNSSTIVNFGEDEKENSDQLVVDEELSNLFSLVTIIFAVVFVLIAILGNIDAKWIHKNDLFEGSAIIVFGLYAMDFISDIFFAASTFNVADPVIFLCSITFLIAPLLINSIQLRRAVSDWIKDAENGYVVMAWIDTNSKLLYMLTMISGSGFAAVRLLNSGLFRRKQFDMGLKKAQMRRFQQKRIWSVVLLENVPQIILQTIYAFQTGIVSSITMMALIFSTFSIILSVLVYSTRSQIQRKQTVNEANVKHISFDVLSNEVSKKGKALKYQYKKINQKIAEILEINPVFVEQLRPKAISGGLQLHFRVDCTKEMTAVEVAVQDIDTIKKRLQAKINGGDLGIGIVKCWKLKDGELSIAHLTVKDYDDTSRRAVSPMSNSPNTASIHNLSIPKHSTIGNDDENPHQQSDAASIQMEGTEKQSITVMGFTPSESPGKPGYKTTNRQVSTHDLNI